MHKDIARMRNASRRVIRVSLVREICFLLLLLFVTNPKIVVVSSYLLPTTTTSPSIITPLLGCKTNASPLFINYLSHRKTCKRHFIYQSSMQKSHRTEFALFQSIGGGGGSSKRSPAESGLEATPQTYESVSTTSTDSIKESPDLHDETVAQKQVAVAVQKEQTASLQEKDEEVATTITENKVTSKLFNLTLLIACFGFAIYSIVSVDAGMTRGWTVAEKAMRIPLDNWAAYEASLNHQPIATKTIINVIIYSLGDWLSQTLFVGEDILEFDARRTLRNGLIGLGFGPLVHSYYEFSDAILPVEIGMNRLYKILMDQTLYISVKCSIYIVAVGLLSGESLEYGVENVRSKLKDIMFTAWKFWPLVHCVTYGVIPARHRILWVNCVDLIWNAILALKTSDDGSTPAEGDDGDNNDAEEETNFAGQDGSSIPVIESNF